MPDAEFEQQAIEMVGALDALPDDDRIIAACRGSGNPAGLAWLAESLGLGPGRLVVDVGAGVGGPAAWLRTRYGCDVVALDPAGPAVRGADRLFALPAALARSESVPIRSESADAVLLIGVLSVTRQPAEAATEAYRIASRLGVLDYCATGDRDVDAGGSTFPTRHRMEMLVAGAGWDVDQTSWLTMDPPRRWTDAGEGMDLDPHPDERPVVAAIRRGAIAPLVLSGRRLSSAAARPR